MNSRGHPLGNVVLTACLRVKDWGKTARRTVPNFFAELAGPRGVYRGVIGADYQQASAGSSPHMRVTTKSARSPEAAKAAMQGGRRPSPSPGEVFEGAARPHPLDSAILIAGITALFYATSVAYEDGFQREFHFRYLSNDVNDLFISATLFGPPLLVSLVITIYLSWAITRRPRSLSKVVDLSFLIFPLPTLSIFFYIYCFHISVLTFDNLLSGLRYFSPYIAGSLILFYFLDITIFTSPRCTTRRKI